MKFLKTTLATTLALSLVLVGCNQNSNTNSQAPSPSANTTTVNNTPAVSTNPDNQPDIAQALQANLNKAGLDASVQSVTPTQMPDMYWAVLDGVSPVFVDKTGKYVISGSIIELGGDTPVDISHALRAQSVVSELEAVDKSEMIIFPAVGETKASIYVFSDPTCHYCQILHKEIGETTASGIEVRYLAWPRGEELVPLSEQVWCSADRQTAITQAKRGQNVTAPACDNPVRKHMALGHRLGVSGTPAVFAENGQQLGGYLPSPELVKQAIANKK